MGRGRHPRRAAGVHGRRARRQGGARGARARARGASRTPATCSRTTGSRSTSRRPTCARSARASTCRWRSRSSPRAVSSRADALVGCAIVGELSLTGDVRAIRGALAIAEGGPRATGSRGCSCRAAARARRRSWTSSRSPASSTCRRPSRCCAASGRPAPVPDREPEADGAGGRARPVRRPRPQRPDRGARGRRGGRPQPVPARPAGHRQDDARPAAARRCCRRSRAHEAIEVTRLHSIAGLHGGGGLVERRPFRAPHHTISASGLVGGGGEPTPGEATLAHHGVLFLDELSEFTRPALEALRQPLEDGHVTIVRAQRVMVFPTRVTLVAASNPCPCGMGEHVVPLQRRRPRAPPAPPQRAAARSHRRLRDRRAAVGGRAAQPGGAGVGRACARASSPRASARPPAWPAPA